MADPQEFARRIAEAKQKAAAAAASLTASIAGVSAKPQQQIAPASQPSGSGAAGTPGQPGAETATGANAASTDMQVADAGHTQQQQYPQADSYAQYQQPGSYDQQYAQYYQQNYQQGAPPAAGYTPPTGQYPGTGQPGQPEYQQSAGYQAYGQQGYGGVPVATPVGAPTYGGYGQGYGQPPAYGAGAQGYTPPAAAAGYAGSYNVAYPAAGYPAAQQPAQQWPAQQPSMVVPTAPPEDAKEAERVDKLAEYVSRNPAFEDLMKKKEQHNPKWQFLFGGDSHMSRYYQWLLYCYRNKIPAEQRDSHVASFEQNAHQYQQQHAQYQQQYAIYLQQQAAYQSQQAAYHQQQQAQPGYIDFTTSDELGFQQLISTLNGSTEFINTSKEWVMPRLGQHSGTIAFKFRKFSQGLEHQVNVGQTQKQQAFMKLLYTVYVLNDVFFSLGNNPSGVTFGQQFKTNCLQQLPCLLRITAAMAASAEDAEKVSRIVQLWEDKGVFDASVVAPLKAAADPTQPLERPPSPYLTPAIAPAAMAMPQYQPTAYPHYQQHPNQSASPPPWQQASLAAAAPPPWQQAPAPAPAPLPWQAPPQAPVPPVMPVIPLPVPTVGSPDTAAYPVSAALAPVGFDLGEMPVGAMAALVKVALKGGLKKYAPIDTRSLPPVAAAHIEPGRLEVRVNEFYRKLDRKVAEEEEARDRERDGRDRDRDYDRDYDRDRRRGRGDSRERDAFGRDRRSDSRDRERERDRGFGPVGGYPAPGPVYGGAPLPAYGGAPAGYGTLAPDHLGGERPPDAAAALQMGRETAIAEDNVGHMMMKKMGWSAGTGLGADGSGIAEPIKDGGQTDKLGIGSRPASSVPPTDEFERFRMQRSYTFRRPPAP